jgi:hypothetical protein
VGGEAKRQNSGEAEEQRSGETKKQKCKNAGKQPSKYPALLRTHEDFKENKPTCIQAASVTFSSIVGFAPEGSGLVGSHCHCFILYYSLLYSMILYIIL